MSALGQQQKLQTERPLLSSLAIALLSPRRDSVAHQSKFLSLKNKNAGPKEL
jgi:hypothetical protein